MRAAAGERSKSDDCESAPARRRFSRRVGCCRSTMLTNCLQIRHRCCDAQDTRDASAVRPMLANCLQLRRRNARTRAMGETRALEPLAFQRHLEYSDLNRARQKWDWSRVAPSRQACGATQHLRSTETPPKDRGLLHGGAMGRRLSRFVAAHPAHGPHAATNPRPAFSAPPGTKHDQRVSTKKGE